MNRQEEAVSVLTWQAARDWAGSLPPGLVLGNAESAHDDPFATYLSESGLDGEWCIGYESATYAGAGPFTITLPRWARDVEEVMVQWIGEEVEVTAELFVVLLELIRPERAKEDIWLME